MMAVQLASSFAGSAVLSGVQTTGRLAAGSALAAIEDRVAMANTAVAAKGKARDRMTPALGIEELEIEGLGIVESGAEAASYPLSPQPRGGSN
jgi:hypothetical protein